ncbi:glycosyltransferase [Colwellia sp. MSW7]|uniref:Glycosyltransferase n=1 Tax=Colwellia maritima TaxID=2912588 RepID=A0ABS9WWN9_9GAMM|nr:glycosyltransferase [Colwellia maritima]MCI2282219.1 glycosyltransferase [Colwellia maritima]
MINIKKICALVVCYKDYHATYSCVKSILDQSQSVAKVFVVDNTEQPNLAHSIYNTANVEILTPNKNLGISGAYILAFKEALKQKMDWCWTFDQDSVARPNALEELLRSVNHINDEKIGIIASTGISKKNGNLYRGNNASWLRLTKPNLRPSIYKCDLVISAGSLTNLIYFKEYGYSFEDMFIDWVDFEICIDMNRNDYSIYSCQTSFYDHYIGGSETADYASDEINAKEISDLRLQFLIKNSLNVILKSKSTIKYFYLIYHIYKLTKNIKKIQRPLFWKTIKTSLFTY